MNKKSRMRTGWIWIATLLLIAPYGVAAEGEPAAVSIREDVVFGTSTLDDGTTIERVMNVYTPQGPADPARPALVFLHGNPGSKPYPGDRQKRFRDYVDHFTPKGYVCFVPSWDLRQGAAAGFEIIRMAMVHIRREASAYGIDPKRVGVIGHSYGSRHACTLGSANFVGDEAKANVVIMLAGGMSYPSDCDENDAPTLLVYGTADEWYPQSPGIQASLRQGNVPHAYVEVADGKHGIPIDTVVLFEENLVSVVENFLALHLQVTPTVPLQFVATRHEGPGVIRLGGTASYGLYPKGYSLKVHAVPDDGARLGTWRAPEFLSGPSPAFEVSGSVVIHGEFTRE